MNRIKSAALTVVTAAITLIGLGFFTTFGLVAVGFLFTLGVIGAVAAGIFALFSSEKLTAGTQA